MTSGNDTATRSGTVTAIIRGETTFHTYTAPEAGFRVNSHLIETATDVTVIDAQLALPFAREVAGVIDDIGKPVSRFIISHGHPDHYSGLQVLAEAHPAADIYALQSVRDYLAEWAQPVLDARRAAFGDIIAARAVYPTATLQPGETSFPGLTISVEEVAEAEAHSSALITFPGARVLAAADLVAAPGYHLFLVIDGEENIPHWIGQLESIAGRTDIDTVLTGHGPTTDPAAAAAAGIDWLRTAARARAGAADAAGYAAAIKARYPDYRDPVWADFGSQMLYGLINP
jgi:glyoxylase-like metal-dependent hydrolase (beta-lactamase superfamily II)